jgi:L-alanine-DL-glutamate epimerase-like enolase superfamily enzyme
LFTAYNSTIKSAFDMVLYDMAAKNANLPLYQYLGGKQKKQLETDITVGIGTPAQMAEKALEFKQRGFRIIKVKLGKNAVEDIERIQQIRLAIGDAIQLRIDANQGWSFEEASFALTQLGKYNIQFCEQPMRRYNDHLLAALQQISPIAIMADESVFDHHDAERIISAKGCSYVNIKLAKSSGIQEAIAINAVCEKNNIACMMGGMLESRVALTAAAHFSTAFDNVQFYDMDTCLIGHKLDPVLGGVQYNGYMVELPDSIGIGADVATEFLKTLETVVV